MSAADKPPNQPEDPLERPGPPSANPNPTRSNGFSQRPFPSHSLCALYDLCVKTHVPSPLR